MLVDLSEIPSLSERTSAGAGYRRKIISKIEYENEKRNIKNEKQF